MELGIKFVRILFKNDVYVSAWQIIAGPKSNVLNHLFAINDSAPPVITKFLNNIRYKKATLSVSLLLNTASTKT